MSNINVYNLPLANPAFFPTSSTATIQALNNIGGGTETKVGAIFLAPVAGTISKITKAGFYISAVAGAPTTYRISIQGVTTAGVPDGTIKNGTTGGSNDVYADFDPVATGFSGWMTLGGGGYNPSHGEALSVVIEPIDDPSIVYITAGYAYSNIETIPLIPFAAVMAAGSWAIIAKTPMIAVQYDNSLVPVGMVAAASLVNTAWGSGTEPLYRGTKWIPSFDCRLIGVYLGVRGATGSDCVMNFFTNKTKTSSVALDISMVFSALTSAYAAFIPFPSTLLTAGTTYRFMLEPSTSTAFSSFPYIGFPDADSLTSLFGSLYGTTLTSDLITAVDYNNSTNGFRGYTIVPVIDQINFDTANDLQYIRNIMEADTYIDKETTPWQLVYIDKNYPNPSADLIRFNLLDINGNNITNDTTVIGQIINLELVPSLITGTNTSSENIEFIKNVLEADKYIDTNTLPWQLVLIDRDYPNPSAELMRKNLYDVDGNNLVAVDTLIGQIR